LNKKSVYWRKIFGKEKKGGTWGAWKKKQRDLSTREKEGKLPLRRKPAKFVRTGGGKKCSPQKKGWGGHCQIPHRKKGRRREQIQGNRMVEGENVATYEREKQKLLLFLMLNCERLHYTKKTISPASGGGRK